MNKLEELKNELVNDLTGDWSCEGPLYTLEDAKKFASDIAQAAQDEVWELIEKVLKEGTIGFHYGKNAFVFEFERDGATRTFFIKSLTAKEAIFEAAKELEIE